MAYSLVQPERIPQISAIDPNSIANSAFIAGVYLAAAGRTATEAEQARFAGKTAAEVANIVLGPQYSPFYPGSQYYTGNQPAPTPSTPTAPTTSTPSTNYESTVTKIYQDLLGRTPDPQGLIDWTNWLKSGKTEQEVISAIAQSPEFQNKWGDLAPVILQLGEPYRTLIGEMKKTLDDINARGQVVNPNIDITPEKAAEFMHQAQQEIDPYYASQLKLAKEGFLRTIGYDKESVLKFEEDLDKQFKKGFKQIGETKAEQGFALSGQRMEQEKELAQTAQGQIDESRRGFANRAQDLGRALYGQYGNFWDEQAYLNANPDVAQAVREGRVSSGYNHWLSYGKNENRSLGNATRLEAPDVFNRTYGEMQIREYPQYLPTGEVKYDTTQKPLYSLSPDIYDQLVGSEEYARRAATRSRASELEAAFREQQNINQQRQLTI